MTSPGVPATWWMVAILAWSLTACGSRDHVVATQTLSDGGDRMRFTAPKLIAPLMAADDHLQDPALSTDELEMYFATPKQGTFDIWRTTRPRVDAPWDPALPVAELNSAAEDFEPELTADGLTLYLSSNRAGSAPASEFRLWVSRRSSRIGAWSQPEVVPLAPFAPEALQRGAAVDASDTSMVFWSLVADENSDLFTAARPAPGAPWGESRILEATRTPWSDWDPSLFRGDLGLIFGSRRLGDHLSSDLFETARPPGSTTYQEPVAMDELNSPSAEGDPWLSEDGRHIVFSSERTGVSRLYESRR